MRCKIHPLEYGGVGVCAACLRERLLALIAAQYAAAGQRSDLDHPTPPPELRPFSPHVTHRRSVDTDFIIPQSHHNPPLFYSTPQINPVSTRNKTPGGFSIFSSLFRHPRSEDSHARRASNPGSWLSSLIPGRRKKKTRFHPAGDGEPPAGRRIARCNRGMSPAAEEDSEEDYLSGSGYSTESAAGPQRPAPTPLRRHVPPRGAPGFGVCLSPLVWSSPNCHRSSHQVGDGGSGVIGVSVEPRSNLKTNHLHHQHRHGHHHRHVSRGGGEALRHNRSRKLADIGRFQ